MAERASRICALDRCLREVVEASCRPECFLTVQDGLASNFASLTKVLYDFHKILEDGKKKDDEEDIDFFEDVDSDEDEGGLFGSEKLKLDKSSRDLKYKDFFDPVESDEDLASGHDELGQLQGEVTAQKRPENSLLEETLHFDHAVRMAPVITEETTLKLEDIIKQRIKDQVWDDVIRKEKPREDAYEYKKRVTLDHEKSKLSLAEIYEQEYLKLNQQKTTEEETPEHLEIKKMMDSLFLKLDALSHFHFIPKPPAPEVKVVSNLPAIVMEEVAPVSVSDAALLAPEEIKEKNKAGDIKTAAEKTATDKKRDRRKKKYQKHMKIKEKEKRRKLLEKSQLHQSGKYTKAAASETLKQLTKTGRASLLKDEGKDKALKSSQAFFSKLQDQLKMQISDTKNKEKKKTQDISIHKLKL
ncbi:PREDICTED: U3 small nucleolar ribonucleoprotein protein MPP10-like [Elephantulus edwardii]|uniref:U3 small nucleolar ribonucleoprotein protein MPP10-like n=1 Tax=Elephantulus edwardii TaxID=28737 RepID=UPI0003F06168|nr:PREDICTED: U3 small nucleolar ribonucleoprotein protein MPP10-like [Elephantulus edwardii]